MNRKLLILVIIVSFFIIFFIWMFGEFIKFYWPGKKDKAVDTAQAYLQNKYKQQMVYLVVRTSFEPEVYKVYFSPENNTNLKFCVEVLPDLSISSDDYYIRYFEQEIATAFKEDIKVIWGGDALMYAYMSTMPISNYNIPNLNEKTKLDDVKQHLHNYYFSVYTAKVFEPGEKQTEAKRIFKMIQIVKDSSYKPDRILFWYFDSKQGKKENNISFDNLNEIVSVEQVNKILDDNWAQ